MKLSSKALLALAISSITATAFAETQSQDFVPTTLAGTSAQSEAKGFVDGFSLGGTTRNWFANEQRFAAANSATRSTAKPALTRTVPTGYKAPSSTPPRASPKAPLA